MHPSHILDGLAKKPPPNESPQHSFIRRVFGTSAGVAFFLFMLVLGIKAIDLGVQYLIPAPWFDAATDERTMRTYNLYPYSGFHLQANYHHTGPMAWGEFYDTFDYKSGDHGFFIDFDLDHPPAKQPNEVRIIWTGGSGAQGWGAQSNKDMLYSLLQERLNDRLKDKGLKISVINLAMGGSVSYQNFIMLNRWAHALEPDMIISYSGANDITVFEANRSNAYNNNFYDLRVLMNTSFYSESPPWEKKLGHWFPGLIKNTIIGPTLRFITYELDMDGYRERERQEMNRAFGIENMPTMYAGEGRKQSVILDKVSIPEYVNTFQSIRRDFPKIPIVIVRQIIDWRRVGKSIPMEADYDRFWSATTAQLKDYGEGSWTFVDLQKYWVDSGFFGPQYRMGFVHLDNEKSKLAADYLTPMLARSVETMRDGSGSSR